MKTVRRKHKVMSEKHESKPASNQNGCYQIRIKGHLGSEWADWFEGLTIALEENGETLITSPVIDQSALHGILKKVRDLGMPLISVCPVKPGPVDPSDVKTQ